MRAPIKLEAHRAAMLVVAFMVLVGSSVACGAGTQNNVIHFGVTATANEPAPSLTHMAKERLQQALESGETSLTIHRAELNTSTVVGADDADISIRRTGTTELEHNGQLRDEAIDKKLGGIGKHLTGIAGRAGQLDLYSLLADLGRTPGNATIILQSSGLQTTGELDLTASGTDIDVSATVDALPADSMPDLSGKRVLFTGLGQVAGPQKPLHESMRRSVVALWLGVCRRFHADECISDSSPTAKVKPVSTVPVPVIQVRDVTTHVVPGAQTPTRVVEIPSSVLFEPETDVLIKGGEEALRQLVSYFDSGTTATVVGHTATVGPRDTAIALSRRRSQKVVGILREFGVAETAFTLIDGVGFDEPIEDDTDEEGRLIPSAAERNRTVVLTLSNHVNG